MSYVIVVVPLTARDDRGGAIEGVVQRGRRVAQRVGHGLLVARGVVADHRGVARGLGDRRHSVARIINI